MGVGAHQKPNEQHQTNQIGIGINLVETGETRAGRNPDLQPSRRKIRLNNAPERIVSPTSPRASSSEGAIITMDITIASGNNHLKNAI
jgi:hypothetical protein